MTNVTYFNFEDKTKTKLLATLKKKLEKSSIKVKPGEIGKFYIPKAILMVL